MGQDLPRAIDQVAGGMTTAIGWAQVKTGPRAPYQLERGRWYEVDQKTGSGNLVLKLPDGGYFDTQVQRVRLRDGRPNAVTRVQTSTYESGDDGGVALRYQGVCPTGHRLFADLLPAQQQAYAPCAGDVSGRRRGAWLETRTARMPFGRLAKSLAAQHHVLSRRGAIR